MTPPTAQISVSQSRRAGNFWCDVKTEPVIHGATVAGTQGVGTPSAAVVNVAQTPKGMMEDGTGRRIDFKNTLIILTSNVGTDLLMSLSRDPVYRNDSEALAVAMKPELLKVFPPALLGRIVTIPYYPLSGAMLAGIVKLQLGRIVKRIADNHKAVLTYGDGVVEHIVSLCNDPDSGGRMIDNIITNTILPALSREFLTKSLAKEEMKQATVGVADGQFTYSWG